MDLGQISKVGIAYTLNVGGERQREAKVGSLGFQLVELSAIPMGMDETTEAKCTEKKKEPKT